MVHRFDSPGIFDTGEIEPVASQPRRLSQSCCLALIASRKASHSIGAGITG